MKVSVIIVSCNRPQGLQRVLQAIEEQSCKPHEVIVVDNGSQESYEQIVNQSFRVPIISVRIPKATISVGRNAGVQKAAGDIIAFTDDDCVPDSCWLEHLQRPFFDNNKMGLVGGGMRVLGDASPLVDELCKSEYDQYNFFAAEHLKGMPCRFPFYFTANVAYRREALASVSGFAETFTVAEDVDIARRLLAKGWERAFVLSAMVSHSNRKTVWSYLKQQIWYYYHHVDLYLKYYRTRPSFIVELNDQAARLLGKGHCAPYVWSMPFCCDVYIYLTFVNIRLLVLFLALCTVLVFPSPHWSFWVLLAVYIGMCVRVLVRRMQKFSGKRRFLCVLLTAASTEVKIHAKFWGALRRGVVMLGACW